MMIKQKSLQTLKNLMLSAAAVFAISSCANDELLKPVHEAAVEESTTDLAAEGSPLAFSLTISGAHTTFAKQSDCASCTFVVPANTFIVDGAALDIKPGAVICLDAAIKYGQLEFVNIEGTPEKPIVISNCGVATEAEVTTTATEEEPY